MNSLLISKRQTYLILGCLLLIFTFIPKSGIAQWSDWIAPKSANELENPLKGNPNALAQGQALFSAICFVCHGNQGKGDGINAPSLAKPPADLTSKRVQRQSDGVLFWKITEGNPPMLSFKETLSEEQRWQIVNFVRELPKLYPPGKPEPKVVKNDRDVSERKRSEVLVTSNKNSKVESPGIKVPENLVSSGSVPLVNPYGNLKDGKSLFKTICGTCHSIGMGKVTGPDLKKVNSRHSKDWLFKWVRSSQSLVNAADPEAVKLFEDNNHVVMPDHLYLKDAELTMIFDYIKEKSNPKPKVNAVAQETNLRNVEGEQKGLSLAQYFFIGGVLFAFFTMLYVILILGKLFLP